MKKCPYCAEQILDDALKCKHCGEWLNKKEGSSGKDFSSLISNGYSYIKKKNTQRVEKKYSHLYEPTDDNPLILNDLRLYESHFYFVKKYSYSDIAFIVFRNSTERMNGVKTRDKIEACVTMTNSMDEFMPEEMGIFDLSYQPLFPVFRNKQTELITFIIEYLERRTFENRLKRYLYFIEKNGFFEIGDYKITNQGNILDMKDQLQTNILDAVRNDLIEYGDTIWEGLKRSSLDPNTFTIYKNAKPSMKVLGMDLSSKVQILNVVNKDVVDFLLSRLVENKRIV